MGAVMAVGERFRPIGDEAGDRRALLGLMVGVMSWAEDICDIAAKSGGDIVAEDAGEVVGISWLKVVEMAQAIAESAAICVKYFNLMDNLHLDCSL